MAFTEAQKTLSYELLGLFQGSLFDWFDYNDRVTGVITSVPITNQIDFTVATARLEVIFTAIEASGDGREARIVSILTEYDDVSLDVTDVKDGGISGMAGVRYKWRSKIIRLKTLLETHLGIHVTASDRLQGGQLADDFRRGGGSIPVGR